MSIFRILVDSLPPAGSSLEVPAEQAHHMLHVRRVKEGDAVICLDRQGHQFAAKVDTVFDSNVTLVLEKELPKQELPTKITVYPALIPEKKFDWLLQKCTELGVSECRPMLTKFCKVKIKDANKKVVRWQRICDDASRQCGGSPMLVNPPLSFAKALKEIHATKIIADQHGTPIKSIQKNDEIALMVGPEGGFSDDEIKLAIENGWQLVSFHNNILRAETATIVCSALLLS